MRFQPKLGLSPFTHFEPRRAFCLLFALSLAENDLTGEDGDEMSGVIALAAALKDSKITHLKYVCHSSASHALCFLGYGTEPAFTF